MKPTVVFLAALLLVVMLGWVYWQTPMLQTANKETLRWNNGDVNLEGTLYTPKSATPAPCVVIVHDAGNQVRSGRSGKLFREHAERLSNCGMAVLIYDQRGCGGSGGNWREASLLELADDVVGAVERLKNRADIDPSKIGLLGCGQGGWVVLVAAEKSSEVDFLITLSGSTVSPAEQAHFSVESTMLEKRQSPRDIQAALALDRQLTDVYRNDAGWDSAAQSIRDVEHEVWFEHSGIGLKRRSYWSWKWFRDLPMDLDPLPLLDRLEIPLLAVHGANDRLVPVGGCVESIDRLEQQGKPFTAIVFADTGHSADRELSKTWTPPAAYWHELRQWLSREGIL